MSQIGHNRKTPLLDGIADPADVRKLEEIQLRDLADELREELVDAVSETGGHLGAGLGVVELTTAIHYVFDTPRDKLVWDVSHQCYPHKILTGRRDRIRSLRRAAASRASRAGRRASTTPSARRIARLQSPPASASPWRAISLAKTTASSA